MAYYKKRTYKKTYKKRNYKKSYKKYSKRMGPKNIPTTINTIAGFAPKILVPLVYTRTNISFGGNSLPYSQQTFLLNDPTQNGTVTSIQGWQTYSQIYDRYLVFASKCEVTFNNFSTTKPMRVSLAPRQFDTALGYTDVVQTELPNCKTANLSVQGGGKDVVKLKNYVKVKNISGVKIDTTTEQYIGYTGSTNSVVALTPPTELWIWSLSANCVDGTNMVSNACYATLKTTYYVMFFERIDGGF